MESNNIAVIGVPLSEWSEVKEQLANISKSLLELKGKDKPDYYKPKEVCELLRCSRNTYESYVDKGFLEPIRMNTERYSRVLIKRADVEYFMENRKSIKAGS